MTNAQQFAGLRVLIVEDETMIAEEIRDRLQRVGCDIIAVTDTGAGAIEAAVTLDPGLILMDIRLKGSMDGIDAAEHITAIHHVPIVYLTAHSDRQTLERAKSNSAYGYVLKPFLMRNLVAAIQVALERFENERRLEDGRLTYATILASISDAVIATDVEGCVRFMNPVAERLTGWPTREALGEYAGTVLQLDEPAPRPRVQDLVAVVLESRASATFGRDAVVRSRGGVQVPVDGGITCIVDALGRLVGASLTMRDVTNDRRADVDLKAMSERLRAVVETAVNGVLLLDVAGNIRMFNPACERLFGYKALELIGRPVDVLLPSPLATLLPQTTKDRDRERPPLLLSARPTTATRRDGTSFPAEISVGEARLSGAPLFVCVIHDLTERKELQQALLDAIGHEQRRFGTDLHDGLGQELTGLSLLISAFVRTANEARVIGAADLEHAQEIVTHAIRSCQAIARGLSPVGGEGGLILALRELVTGLNGPSGPRIDLAVSEVARLGLSAAAADHLFRIAQEALANALKHAHAHAIHVRLDIEAARVRLAVCDDGEGLAASGSERTGLGLRTMQYRAAVIGARLEIGPAPAPPGTCIVCECPQAA
jgi:PAS domain S-box-containing protein